MGRAEFASRAIGAMLQAALEPGRRLVIDYADLPDAVWTRVAPNFGFETSPQRSTA